MGFWDVFNAFIPLIIIVALLYGVLILVKKYGRNFKGQRYSPVSISVVTTKMIMPKKYISVVKVEDKLLVLGVSDQSINLLKEIEDTSEYTTVTEPGDEGFMDMLKKNLRIK